jgi:hypothetical protein
LNISTIFVLLPKLIRWIPDNHPKKYALALNISAQFTNPATMFNDTALLASTLHFWLTPPLEQMQQQNHPITRPRLSFPP